MDLIHAPPLGRLIGAPHKPRDLDVSAEVQVKVTSDVDNDDGSDDDDKGWMDA